MSTTAEKNRTYARTASTVDELNAIYVALRDEFDTTAGLEYNVITTLANTVTRYNSASNHTDSIVYTVIYNVDFSI